MSARTARAVRAAARAAVGILLAAAMLCTAAVAGPALLGFKSCRISSDSMSPALSAGDLIYIKPVDPSVLRAGQITAFRTVDSTVVTHRVTRVDVKNHLLYTRGDRNGRPDPSAVPFGSVLGAYTGYRIPAAFLPGFLR